MAAWKPHSDQSDKKRTPKFFGEIKTMINNDPSLSINSIARDIGMSEFLIRQVVHDNILYFSYKMRKYQFSSQAIKEKRKDF